MRLTLTPPAFVPPPVEYATLSGRRASYKGAAYAGVLNYHGIRVVSGSPSVVQPTFLAHVLSQPTPEKRWVRGWVPHPISSSTSGTIPVLKMGST